jgi:acylphosphatase
MSMLTARRYLISGAVQGVGFRYFAERVAREIGVTGWTRNLDDGRVEVHANGSRRQLDDLESRLRQGPPRADVRSVEVTETAVLELRGFHIRYS